MQVGAIHWVVGLGTAFSMKRVTFMVSSGSPDEAITEKFQSGLPQPPVAGVPEGVNNFFLGSRKNKPASPPAVLILPRFDVWLS